MSNRINRMDVVDFIQKIYRKHGIKVRGVDCHFGTQSVLYEFGSLDVITTITCRIIGNKYHMVVVYSPSDTLEKVCELIEGMLAERVIEVDGLTPLPPTVELL